MLYASPTPAKKKKNGKSIKSEQNFNEQTGACGNFFILVDCSQLVPTRDRPQMKLMELYCSLYFIRKKNLLFIVFSLAAALLLPRSVSVGLKSFTYPPGLCAHGTITRVLQVVIIY